MNPENIQKVKKKELLCSRIFKGSPEDKENEVK